MNLKTITSKQCLSFENCDDNTHVFDIEIKNENNEVQFVMNLDTNGFCMKLNQTELRVLISYLQEQLV
jgi:hypothetical protein